MQKPIWNAATPCYPYNHGWPRAVVNRSGLSSLDAVRRQLAGQRNPVPDGLARMSMSAISNPATEKPNLGASSCLRLAVIRFGGFVRPGAPLVHVAGVAKLAFSGRHEIPASARHYLPIGDNGVTLLLAPSFSVLSGLLIDGLALSDWD